MSYFERGAEQAFLFTYRRTWYTSAHFHSAPELIFVEKGEVETIINGEKRTLRAGDACFVDGFCIHTYTDTPDTRAFILLTQRQFFERYETYFQEEVPPRFFRFENFSLLRKLQALCAKNYENERSRYASFEGTVGILLAEISQTAPFVKRQKDKSAELVCAVLQYAEDNLSSDLSLRAVAKRFTHSYEYLSRTLNKSLRESWGSYVNRLRVRKAHERLQSEEDSTVLEIALDCGFDSPNTFYRAYKKEYGFPPRRVNEQKGSAFENGCV